jgi:hypothetical protein
VALVSLSVAILPVRRRPAWLLTTVVVVVMGKFYAHELTLGQVNILFAAMAALGILMMRRKQDATAAWLFLAAVVVKPYAVVFLPWLVMVRGARAMLATAVGCSVLLIIPAMLYGIDGAIELHQAWWHTVARSTAPNLTNADNVSIAGLAAKWLGKGRLASGVALGISVALIAALSVVLLRRRGVERAEALEGALLLTLIPLLSPQGWDYVFLVATPAVVLFANHDDGLASGLRWLTWVALGIIGFSLFDLMGRENYARFMSWSVITVCFLFLIRALVALRLRRIA